MTNTAEVSEERIARLEEHVAHQAHTIEELSDQLSDQWKQVSNLQNKYEQLVQRLLAFEEQSRPIHDRPIIELPHY